MSTLKKGTATEKDNSYKMEKENRAEVSILFCNKTKFQWNLIYISILSRTSLNHFAAHEYLCRENPLISRKVVKN